LIRGILSASYHWWQFDKKLADRFSDSTVTCVELLGNGTLHVHKTPLNMVENVSALKKQTNTKKKKILIGFSLGGIVAAEWAQIDRKEIAAIVLVNSSLKDEPFYYRLKPSSWWPIFKIPFIVDQYAREKHSISITSKLLDDHSLEKVALEWGELNQRYPMNPLNFLRQAFLASNVKRMSEAPCPMLVLSSKNDQVTNSVCSERIAKKLKVAHCEHDQAGHDLTLDAPDWAIDKITEFLNDNLYQKVSGQ
jgi:pimeloyl-ACP methyl ester carboxylesterase